jgi:hypothetical protein
MVSRTGSDGPSDLAWCEFECRAPTCAVSSDVALLMAFSNNGERDALSLRQDV